MNTTNRRKTALAVTSGLLALVVTAALGVTASVVNAQAQPGAGASVAPAAMPSTDQPLPPEKAAFEAQVAADQAANAAVAADPIASAKAMNAKAQSIADHASVLATSTEQLSDLRADCPEGAMLAEAPPGAHGDTFVVTSGWVQFAGDQCLAIYAGQAGSDHPMDGAVYIIHTSLDTTAPGNSGAAPGQANGNHGVVHRAKLVTVPGSGPLTIQGATPGKVYVTTASGQTYTVTGQSDQVKPGRV